MTRRGEGDAKEPRAPNTQPDLIVSFEAFCADWQAAHPSEPLPAGDLFADWLAGVMGEVVIGGPAGESPSVVALPDDDLRRAARAVAVNPTGASATGAMGRLQALLGVRAGDAP